MGFYGSLTADSMHKILVSMLNMCGLSSGSHLVDVGSGLCRPLMHAILLHGVQQTTGIEIDPIKCTKSRTFVDRVVAKAVAKGLVSSSALPPRLPRIIQQSIGSIPPAVFQSFTHAFSFWEGVPAEERQAFGRLATASSLLQCVVVVQRKISSDPAVAAELMHDDYDFKALELMDTISVSMAGSGRKFWAYVFRVARGS